MVSFSAGRVVSVAQWIERCACGGVQRSVVRVHLEAKFFCLFCVGLVGEDHFEVWNQMEIEITIPGQFGRPP